MREYISKEKAKIALFITIYVISIAGTRAQTTEDTAKSASPILVSNDNVRNCPVILVKWLTDKLVYPNGVNIYRQEPGELTWNKLNTKPLVKGLQVPSASEYIADTTLKYYIELGRRLKPSDLKEMTKVFVLVKSVQSQPFARYMGIQYDDTVVAAGKTYRYKVAALTARGEENIGHSEFIKAEAYVPALPPSGIEVVALDGKVTVKWLPEDMRFHGVNVYRSSSRDTITRRINKTPLMISKRQLPKGKLEYPDIFFTDIKLQNNVRYTYQLTAIDFFGRESHLSEKFTVMPGDRKPPLPPQFAKGKVDKYNVRVSWRNQSTPDQEGINIYRSYQHDDHYVKMNSALLPVTDTVYEDNDLKAGFYYYIVAAVDSAGNEGKSLKVLAEVHDITPPDPPKNIAAIADTERIILTWDANTEPDIMGYQIYRTVGKDIEDYYVLLNSEPMQTLSFIDTLPKNARNCFFYKVTAVDSALNRSKYPRAVKAQMPDIMPPVQPVIINVGPKDDYLVIEWVANNEPDLAGYDIYRTTESAGTKEQLNIGLLSPTVTRFTDRTAASDTLYYYTLVASDSAGNRSIASKPFTGMLQRKGPVETGSEIIKFTVKQPLFSKYLKLQWSIRTGISFLGATVYKRTSPDAEPQRLNNLTMEHSITDHDKKPAKAQYQLRLYHKTGGVVKSEWISKQ